MMLPGRTVVASMTDGTSVRGVTCWSWAWLRLRSVSSDLDSTTPDVSGRLMIPPHALTSVQVLPKEVR